MASLAPYVAASPHDQSFTIRLANNTGGNAHLRVGRFNTVTEKEQIYFDDVVPHRRGNNEKTVEIPIKTSENTRLSFSCVRLEDRKTTSTAKDIIEKTLILDEWLRGGRSRVSFNGIGLTIVTKLDSYEESRQFELEHLTQGRNSRAPRIIVDDSKPTVTAEFALSCFTKREDGALTPCAFEETEEEDSEIEIIDTGIKPLKPEHEAFEFEIIDKKLDI